MTRFELVTYRLRIDCTTTVLHRRGGEKMPQSRREGQGDFGGGQRMMPRWLASMNSNNKAMASGPAWSAAIFSQACFTLRVER